MRRFGFLVLAAVVGLATPAAAQDGGASPEPGPSLEYRPQRLVIPEPKAPKPAPPVTIFREIIGRFGMATESFDAPVDVAADADGNFYVLDAGNDRIQMFDKFSNFVLAMGVSGSRATNTGEFSNPGAIAVDSRGFIYVVDTGNHRIQKLAWDGPLVSGDECKECPVRPDGKRLAVAKTWGGLGSRAGDFKFPRDITFDAAGNIYVLDAGNERVQIFDSIERFVGEWGRLFGSRGGVFTDLVSIGWSRDRLGYIFLLGAGCLVQKFQMDGTWMNSWPAVAPESGLCVPGRLEIDNKNDYVYFLDAGNGLFERFSLEGLFHFALSGAAQPFSKPLGFSVNPDRDEVLVADTENNVVQKFTLR